MEACTQRGTWAWESNMTLSQLCPRRPEGAYLEEGLEWGDHFKHCHIKGVIQRGESQEPDMWKNYSFMERHPELKEEFLAQMMHQKQLV